LLNREFMKSGEARVIRYKALLMQRLLDHVRHDYRHHVSGVVQAERVKEFRDKFSDRYEIHLNTNQRAYREMRGEANG
jgi:hypothetical protein